MGTTQSVVARLESGQRMPSMRTVQRYASAIGARAVVRLEIAAGRGNKKAAA
jgi:transcriptional regulator with XRE-family HTH domain